MLLILFTTKDLQRIVFLANMVNVVGDPEIGLRAGTFYTLTRLRNHLQIMSVFFVLVGLHTPEQTQREIVQAILSFGGCVSDALLHSLKLTRTCPVSHGLHKF